MNRVDDVLGGDRDGGRYVSDFGIPYLPGSERHFEWPCWEFFREDVDGVPLLDIVN